MGRIAVDQPPSGGSRYPFAAPTALAAGVLDAYLAHEDDDRLRPHPFALTLAGTAGAFTAEVTDADGGVVASVASGAAATTAWGTDRVVYQWVEAATVLRLVVRPADFAAGTADLDPRTCNRVPGRVRSFRVGGTTVAGRVRFEAGYNLDLEVEDQARVDGGRRVARFRLDAAPGAGSGRAPGCGDPSPGIKRINNLPPDTTGNFVIEADGCHRSQFPTDAPAAIALANDCRPCCPCDDYVRVYKGLRLVFQRWKDLARDAETVRDEYAENRQRWLDTLACREASPVTLVVGGEYRCRAAAGASFCNLTDCCLTGVEVRFTVRVYRDGVLVADPAVRVTTARLQATSTGGRLVDYSPTVVGLVIRFFADYVDPGTTVAVAARLCLDCSPTPAEQDDPPQYTVEVTASVHAADPPPNPNTGAECALTTAEVPEFMSDLWSAAGLSADGARAVSPTRLAPLTSSGQSFSFACSE